ncbi:MAG TPA: metallophosphoesterase [Gemmatimonadales bacterium]|nr:metallophosphoesterase [Gemmatimonadales bacterium]
MPGISRRAFLSAAAAAGASAVAGDMFAVEPRRLVVSRHELPVRRLSPRLDGLRVAHVTDVHLPANTAVAEEVLGVLARERPEVVLFTGDICETSAAESALAGYLRRAHGTVASFATLGNWEYRGGLGGEAGRRAYEAGGVPLLINAHETIELHGAALTFVGLDDYVAGEPNPNVALQARPRGVPEIWLTHAPELADRLPFGLSARPALLLAGHTHGGQIRVPGFPAYTPFGSGRFVAGWYRDTFAPLYVSRGIGTADVRARFFCPPELPIFTLRKT